MRQRIPHILSATRHDVYPKKRMVLQSENLRLLHLCDSLDLNSVYVSCVDVQAMYGLRVKDARQRAEFAMAHQLPGMFALRFEPLVYFVWIIFLCNFYAD